MTKRELVIAVSDQWGYTQSEVADVVQAILDTITETLARGDRLEIRNFGVFEVKERNARVGRNPRNGEKVPVQKKRVPVFKPGKLLKKNVMNSQPDTSNE